MPCTSCMDKNAPFRSEMEKTYICTNPDCNQKWWKYNAPNNWWTTVGDKLTWEKIKNGNESRIIIGTPSTSY